jgi:hypothetical protein
MTETIAACGWETIAPLPGRWSFTNALIESLEEWVYKNFSVAMLHSQILSMLKHEKPEREGQKKIKVECRRTPVYILTTENPGTPSINMSKKFRIKSQTFQGFLPKLSAPNVYDVDKLTSSSSNGNFNIPHVLISLALDEDQDLDTNACSKWLASFPMLAKHAKVEGVYKSHSTLVVASVPVAIWDLLPENPACLFIGYVTSTNFLDRHMDTKRNTVGLPIGLRESGGRRPGSGYVSHSSETSSQDSGDLYPKRGRFRSTSHSRSHSRSRSRSQATLKTIKLESSHTGK